MIDETGGLVMGVCEMACQVLVPSAVRCRYVSMEVGLSRLSSTQIEVERGPLRVQKMRSLEAEWVKLSCSNARIRYRALGPPWSRSICNRSERSEDDDIMKQQMEK